MNTNRERSVVRAAEQVTLKIGVCAVTKNLYGYACPVLDEKATLRRVALSLNGTARCPLTQDEQDVALAVIRHRHDH